MEQITDGPCADWPLVACEMFPASTAAVSGIAVQAASEILWNRSGRQFGTCTVTLRPCREDCWSRNFPEALWRDWPSSPGYPYPYLYGGQWYNLGCGGCPGTCSCTVLERVSLPTETVSISGVKVDGVTLDPSAYTLYDHRTLLRVDGGRWPLCNDLNLADTETGTWSITLTYGHEVPALGQMALGELAVELAKACVRDSSCKLPSTVQSVVRQGVTLTMFDPNAVFADGKLGLRTCDLFLSTFNPGNLRARARVYDVDTIGGPRRQT